MKETGLMFKAPLVRAILSGQKTQTRRICKPAVAHNLSRVVEVPDPQERGQVYNGSNFGDEEGDIQFLSPFGGLSDRIYVRETWNWFDPQVIPANRAGPRAPFTGNQGGREIEWVTAYAADGPLPYPGYNGREHWRPSIHMPKWAARIWLEITGVRVERLQAISEEDAEAEGVGFLRSVPDADETLTAKQLFECLWDSTGGDWSANPWVWVIDFKRIDQLAPKEAP